MRPNRQSFTDAGTRRRAVHNPAAVCDVCKTNPTRRLFDYGILTDTGIKWLSGFYCGIKCARTAHPEL